MRPRFYLFVNGIRANSNDLEGWQFRAERYVQRNQLGQANTYHYGVLAIAKWVMRPRHVKRLAKFIRECVPYECDLVLTGHSEGGDLICETLKVHDDLRAARVHLVAAAARSSFWDNGMNDALLGGRVGKVSVYYNPADTVLKVAKDTAWIPFLNYGHLGLMGPTDVDPRVDNPVKVECVKCPADYGHSGYFDPGERFDWLMSRIVGP